MKMKHEIRVKINGMLYCEEVDADLTLLRFIREKIGLTGTKCGCENGECGACTVMLDEHPVRSCLVLAVEVDGSQVITVEGLATGENLTPLQQAFIDEGAAQCGFCTPGILIGLQALLNESENPSQNEIKQAVGGHLCRCTGYSSISKAVKLVLDRNNI